MSYGWPLKPFDRPHPVRANLNDPRISGPSKAFHFGIDVSAPNGTAVYAVEAGKVHLEDPRAISVLNGDVAFGYWHVVPAVAHHQLVAKHLDFAAKAPPLQGLFNGDHQLIQLEGFADVIFGAEFHRLDR